MATTITVLPAILHLDARPGSIFVDDVDNEGGRTVSEPLEGDGELKLGPWLCVLGAFTFVIPSFG